MNLYDFTVLDIDKKPVSLSEYKGKVVLIVNTATRCGFTPQFAKIEVNGDKADPLYNWLKSEQKGTFGNAIKWNFKKFL